MKKDINETITISIPSCLLEMVDIIAAEYDYSRSKFISHAIRDKVVSTLYKNSSAIRDDLYSSVIKNFQIRND